LSFFDYLISFYEKQRTELMTDNKERHPDEALFDIGSDLTDLQEQFGGAFTHEEAEAVVAGFDGDVQRASELYRELTEDYAGSMTVEDLIKAGKENA
jgi:hypothetical protein